MDSTASIIHYYNRLNGNAITLPTLSAFAQRVQKYLDSAGHGPHTTDLKGILSRVAKAIKLLVAKKADGFERIELTPIEAKEVEGKKETPPKPSAKKIASAKKKRVGKTRSAIAKRIMDKTPDSVKKKVSEYGANKVAGLPQPAKSTAKHKVAVKQPTNLSGVDYQYHEINLGPYKKDFHRMMSDTIVQIHGMPGHGKTVWLLKHAQYRAEQGENTLYVAREEHGRSVFDMKLKEHGIGHANLRFRKTLTPEDLAWAQVIFLDSVSALDIDHKDLEKLAADNPNKNWFIVLQSTKEGDFRGSQEWEHLVDIAGEVSNRKLILNKNRLDPNNSVKAEKKRIDDAIVEGKKKIELREAVKAQTAKPKPEIVNQKIITPATT